MQSVDLDYCRDMHVIQKLYVSFYNCFVLFVFDHWRCVYVVQIYFLICCVVMRAHSRVMHFTVSVCLSVCSISASTQKKKTMFVVQRLQV